MTGAAVFHDAATGPLLEVEDLSVHFETPDGLVRAVDGVSFRLERGERLGVVGESGSGKSVTFLTVMGLITKKEARISGSVRYLGQDLLTMKRDELRAYRGRRMAMIFQDPMSSLHPFYKVGAQIVEAIRVHEDISKTEARARAIDMLRLVGIPQPEDRVDQYPHEYSGGMRQRAMIAMALVLKPDLLIADEPTTALDVTVQAQILELMDQLRSELGMAVALITHDLGVVAGYTDRVQVMYAGRLVETGSRDAVFYRARHPYTWGLLRSLARLDSSRERLIPIEGAPPSLITVPSGCAFHPRCPYAFDPCPRDVPALLEDEVGHRSACHLSGEDKQRIFSEEVARKG